MENRNYIICEEQQRKTFHQEMNGVLKIDKDHKWLRIAFENFRLVKYRIENSQKCNLFDNFWNVILIHRKLFWFFSVWHNIIADVEMIYYNRTLLKYLPIWARKAPKKRVKLSKPPPDIWKAGDEFWKTRKNSGYFMRFVTFSPKKSANPASARPKIWQTAAISLPKPLICDVALLLETLNEY